jgi:UDP-N-acetylmuramate-alanine ligase
VDDVKTMAAVIAEQVHAGDVVLVMGAGTIGSVAQQVVDAMKETK